MLCLIVIVGGLLIMMGRHDRSEALFYYFRLEDHVPETLLTTVTDLLRWICLHFWLVLDLPRRDFCDF
jgi:hypothetical protein